MDFNLKSNSHKQHDIAAQTLKDLYDMAVFFSKKQGFMEKLADIVEANSKSKAKLDRFAKIGLPMSELRFDY